MVMSLERYLTIVSLYSVIMPTRIQVMYVLLRLLQMQLMDLHSISVRFFQRMDAQAISIILHDLGVQMRI